MLTNATNTTSSTIDTANSQQPRIYRTADLGRHAHAVTTAHRAEGPQSSVLGLLAGVAGYGVAIGFAAVALTAFAMLAH